MHTDSPVTPAAAPVDGRVGAHAARLDSLDAFRGLTIAAMLLVNNPGSWSHVYAPLRHAAWHGWTPTDLIFPFFLFIVGVAMTFSLARRSAEHGSAAPLLVAGWKRAAILIALGLFLNAFGTWDPATLRIPGVLQRIGLAYAIALPIVLFVRPRAQGALAAAILIGYWALLTRVPLPDGSAPSLEAGRDLGAWIDRAVFGQAHLWAQSRTWDPEGLLSTLPAVATVLAGVFAGRWIRSRTRRQDVTTGLCTAAAAALALGWLWGLVFPINKNLWTSSYVLFTAGCAGLLLAGMHWIMDVQGRRAWARPLVVFGTNAIAAFFLSSLFSRVLGMVRIPTDGGAVTLKTWLWTRVFEPLAPPRAASLAFAATYVLLWLAVLAVLHRRRIFIRV